MKKVFVFCFIFALFNTFSFSYAKENADKTISYKLFSITIPQEFDGIYSVKKKHKGISVYHKESKKAGFGGFAFGIRAYKSPAEHANLPGGRKIGELTDKNGVIYDMVLKYPTDVQYDYTKECPVSFKNLYNLGETVRIQGIKGSIYTKDKGTKGKDLYTDILKKHVTAINEKWDSEKLEKENMSYMYNVIAQIEKNPKKVLDKIGYIYYDANADGIEELLIGEIANGEWKGVIYDMYTMVNRKPEHVVSGGERNRYYICNDVFVCNEYSEGAGESGMRIYCLVENSTELFPQVTFKYDSYENPKQPWFWAYSDNKWENVTEEAFYERKKVFDRYKRFEFIPLSKLKI